MNTQLVINKFNQATAALHLSVEAMADCVNTFNSALAQAVKESEELKKKLDNSLAENQELKSGLEALKNQISESKPNLPEF